jgi:hypothetical protein
MFSSTCEHTAFFSNNQQLISNCLTLLDIRYGAMPLPHLHKRSQRHHFGAWLEARSSSNGHRRSGPSCRYRGTVWTSRVSHVTYCIWTYLSIYIYHSISIYTILYLSSFLDLITCPTMPKEHVKDRGAWGISKHS